VTKGENTQAAFAERVAAFDILAGLHRAVDVAYARASRAARARWKSAFAGDHDASDDIISVRIVTSPQSQRGSAFLPARAQSRRAETRGLSRPSFATNK
jgi:hypothetical protein